MPYVYNAACAGGANPFVGILEAVQKEFQQHSKARGDEEFVPDIDVFDSSREFILHVSLPGANREDIGVDFDPVRTLPIQNDRDLY